MGTAIPRQGRVTDGGHDGRSGVVARTHDSGAIIGAWLLSSLIRHELGCYPEADSPRSGGGQEDKGVWRPCMSFSACLFGLIGLIGLELDVTPSPFLCALLSYSSLVSFSCCLLGDAVPVCPARACPNDGLANRYRRGYQGTGGVEQCQYRNQRQPHPPSLTHSLPLPVSC